MRYSNKLKAALVLGVTVAGVAGTAVPATAAASPALFDVHLNMAKPTYPVASHCEISAGYTLDPRFVNYVVHASADAAGPSVAMATSVQCTVYDALDKSRTYGGASSAMFGPHAEAVGQATVPVGRIPAVCVVGGATYLDGTTVAPSRSCP